MKSHLTSKTTVVKLWTLHGFVDFYIGFDIRDRFDWYSAFLWHQGLEKFCKAYLLGTKSSEYECLPEQQARETIDKIVRKEMGHNLIEMLDKLIAIKVLNKEVKTKVYRYYGKDFTGEELIEILEKAYIECRYPLTTDPVKRVYFTPAKTSWWDPLASQELMGFTFEVGLKILGRIEKDFNINIPRNRTENEGLLFKFVKDEDWLRFRRYFFEEDV